MCYKRSGSRVQLQNLRRFLNKNRMWICLENCIIAPQCQYCQLIYQINYSYKCNKLATVKTFRSSILGPAFLMLEDIYAEHKERRKWKNYDKSFKKSIFKKQEKSIYKVSFLN